MNTINNRDNFPYEHLEKDSISYKILREYWNQHGTMPIQDILLTGEEKPLHG